MAYELTFIIHPLMEKPEADAAAEKVRNFINELGGSVKSSAVGEKTKLAYPIKKQVFGYYAVQQFELETEKMDELKTKLRLEKDILRHLILIYDEKKALAPKAPRKPRAVAPSTAEETQKSIEKSEKAEKVKIEELDKKLEEILKD